MRLLQFSTSHYCRKARLVLGYKRIPYTVTNLTPGLHLLQVRSLTGLTTTPVLLPEQDREPLAIGDSTRIWQFLEQFQPDPPLLPQDPRLQSEAQLIEDWLDESIGTATRFVYYQFRAREGKSLDPSWSSMAVIQVVRRQYGINTATATLAEVRLKQGIQELSWRWTGGSYLVGQSLTIADLTAAALLSPLARIPDYRQAYPWLFERIRSIHALCQEAFPPGLEEETAS